MPVTAKERFASSQKSSQRKNETPFILNELKSFKYMDKSNVNGCNCYDKKQTKEQRMIRIRDVLLPYFYILDIYISSFLSL